MMQRSNQGEKGSETPCVPSGEAHEFASKVYQLLHCPGRWSIFNLLWSPSRVTSEAGRNGFEHTCEFGRAPLKEMMRRGKGEMRGVVGPQRIHNLLSLLNLTVPPPNTSADAQPPAQKRPPAIFGPEPISFGSPATGCPLLLDPSCCLPDKTQSNRNTTTNCSLSHTEYPYAVANFCGSPNKKNLQDQSATGDNR